MRKIKKQMQSSWLNNKPFHHRGFHNDKIIENTLEAFTHSIKQGYGFEFDVRLTKDNFLVVFHDENLKRLLGVDLNIKETNYSDLNKINPNFHFPLLSEVLNLVGGKVPLLIEVKSGAKGAIEPLIIKELKDYKGHCAILSFDPFILNNFKKLAPHILRGQNSSNFTNIKMSFFKKFLLKNTFLNYKSKPHFISYDINDFNVRTIKRLKRKYFIIGWTYKNRVNEKQLKPLFDNVIFEDIKLEEF